MGHCPSPVPPMATIISLMYQYGIGGIKKYIYFVMVLDFAVGSFIPCSGPGSVFLLV